MSEKHAGEQGGESDAPCCAHPKCPGGGLCCCPHAMTADKRAEAAEVEALDERHPEDYCHRCGGPNISWFTPGGVWDPVMRPAGTDQWRWNEIICPLCFVELARTERGIDPTWALLPTGPDGTPWTSADERAEIRAEARAEGAQAVLAAVETVAEKMTAGTFHAADIIAARARAAAEQAQP